MYLCVHNRVVQIWGASSVSRGGRREGEDAFAGGKEGGIESSSKEFEAYHVLKYGILQTLQNFPQIRSLRAFAVYTSDNTNIHPLPSSCVL